MSTKVGAYTPVPIDNMADGRTVAKFLDSAYLTHNLLIELCSFFIFLWFPWDYPINEEIPNSI